MPDKPDKPQFKHDCGHCIYLGAVDDDVDNVGGKYDAYVHPDEEYGATLVLRYGNEDWQYRALPQGIVEQAVDVIDVDAIDPAYRQALTLAKAE